MFFVPESPYYSITKGDESKAATDLKWLRGTSDVTEELEELKRAYGDQQLLGNVSYIKIFVDRIYLEPFLIMIALMIIQQFSGINAVLFYLKVWLSVKFSREKNI